MIDLTMTAAGTTPAISLADAKAHLRLAGDTTDDETIRALVSVAEAMVERESGLRPILSTYRMRIDEFPCSAHGLVYSLDPIELPRGPLGEVSSIVYLDPDGTEQTLSASLYRSVGGDRPRIEPALGEFWPLTAPLAGAVTITFTAGYATAAAIPADLVHAMKLMIAAWYDHRDEIEISRLAASNVPFAARYLMSRPRVF